MVVGRLVGAHVGCLQRGPLDVRAVRGPTRATVNRLGLVAGLVERFTDAAIGVFATVHPVGGET